MKKKIVLKDKFTNTIVNLNNRASVIRNLFTPYSEKYIDYSPLFREILDLYKDRELVKYKWTEQDKRAVEENPDAILDIPRYVVKGYDRAVGCDFDQKARNEFYKRFTEGSEEVVRFINDTNDRYTATIKYII